MTDDIDDYNPYENDNDLCALCEAYEDLIQVDVPRGDGMRRCAVCHDCAVTIAEALVSLSEAMEASR